MSSFRFWSWSEDYRETAEQQYRRLSRKYELDLKRLEAEGVQTAIDAARVKMERERAETMLVYQDIQRQRMEMEIRQQVHLIDLELKRRDIEMLYPNDMGAYPVHLNPNPEWNPLLLPSANSKYTPPEPGPAPAKPFSELLRDGTISYAQSQNKLVLGYAQGELRYGSWLDLYSCGIGGVSGSGKTTTVRFLLFQAILAGSHLIMVDPHIGEPEESLAAQFTSFTGSHLFEPCGDYPSLIMERVHYLQKELAHRKDKGIKGPFIVLVIDEYNAVMRVEKVRNAVSNLLVAIGQEGRKFGIFAMLLGQRWSAQDIGGADVRSSLASVLVHRFTDRDQATKLLGDGRSAHKTLSLPQGHYLFRDTNGTLCEMTTPNTIYEDGEEVQRMLKSPETSSHHIVESSIQTEPLKPVRNQSETSVESSSRNQSDTRLEALGARILQMQAKGLTKPEVIRGIWGAYPGAGERYEQANKEYMQAINAVCEKLGLEIQV